MCGILYFFMLPLMSFSTSLSAIGGYGMPSQSSTPSTQTPSPTQVPPPTPVPSSSHKASTQTPAPSNAPAPATTPVTPRRVFNPEKMNQTPSYAPQFENPPRFSQGDAQD